MAVTPGPRKGARCTESGALNRRCPVEALRKRQLAFGSTVVFRAGRLWPNRSGPGRGRIQRRLTAVRSGETRPSQRRLNLFEVRGTKVPRVLRWTANFARSGTQQPYGHAAQAVRSGPPFPSGDLTAGRRGQDVQPGQAKVDDRRYSGLVGRGKSMVASGRGGGCRTVKASLDPWPTKAWSALGFRGLLGNKQPSGWLDLRVGSSVGVLVVLSVAEAGQRHVALPIRRIAGPSAWV
jgi:hypothetical protein